MSLIAPIHAAAAHFQAPQNVIMATEDSMLSRCRACIREGGHHLKQFLELCDQLLYGINSNISAYHRWNARAGETGDPREKTRRSATSSGTIPTCENPGVTPPETEPGSLTITPKVLIADLVKFFGIAGLRVQEVFKRSVNLRVEGHGGIAIRVITSHLGEPGSDSRRGGFRIFASVNRAGRCRWSAGFLRNLPPPNPPNSGASPYSPAPPSSALEPSIDAVARAIPSEWLERFQFSKLIDGQRSGRGYSQCKICCRRHGKGETTQTNFYLRCTCAQDAYVQDDNSKAITFRCVSRREKHATALLLAVLFSLFNCPFLIENEGKAQRKKFVAEPLSLLGGAVSNDEDKKHFDAEQELHVRFKEREGEKERKGVAVANRLLVDICHILQQLVQA
ncbi:hypothetical protein PR048_015125 [Dryococelus australis]|uniref:Uncharacterized protein n=1 Tax=Dryococelus australis TaxID=614101 RepID=A0ABQ9HGB9_9NEOP|nr:hypothetical protein PR048_015125 [Dryococelus australis]